MDDKPLRREQQAEELFNFIVPDLWTESHLQLLFIIVSLRRRWLVCHLWMGYE